MVLEATLFLALRYHPDGPENRYPVLSISWQGCQSCILHGATHGKMVEALVTHVLNPKNLMYRIIKKTAYSGTANSTDFCL